MKKSSSIELGGDGSFLEMDTMGESALLLNSDLEFRQKVSVTSKKMPFSTVSRPFSLRGRFLRDLLSGQEQAHHGL
jgi:hypothetical protein